MPQDYFIAFPCVAFGRNFKFPGFSHLLASQPNKSTGNRRKLWELSIVEQG